VHCIGGIALTFGIQHRFPKRMSVGSSRSPEPTFEPRQATRKQIAGRLWRLVLKELREIFRDRRTIITLVVMPVLIYPLLALVFQRFLLTSLTSQEESVYSLGIETELDKNLLIRQLELGQAVLEQRGSGTTANSPEGALPKLSWTFLQTGEIEKHVADSAIHLGVISRQKGGATSGTGLAAPLTWELSYRESTPASVEALHFVESRLQALSEAQVDQQLRNLGIAASIPAAVSRRPVRFTGAPVFSLAALIPLILVLTTMTGAVYPAIDLTAGERERGTMEMLIAAPVPRLGLLLAKYVAVLAVALLTAVVNLLGMTITAHGTGLAAILFGEGGMSLAIVIKIWLLLGLFAAFFSAVLLAITCYARSFKEAQAYIIPLMLLCLVPGVICLLPGLEFRGFLAVTPLVNIVMLARDVLEGDAPRSLAAAALLSTGLYVTAAIALAARIFGTDAVLYGSPSTWADVFRRPAEPQAAASPSAAMSALALMFPLYFVAAGLLARAYPDPFSQLGERVMMGGLVTALVFAAVPAAIAVFLRLRPDSGLGLRRPTLIALLAAAILGLSAWPFAHEIFLLGQWLGIGQLNFERISGARNFADQLKTLPLPMVLFALALVPAICEEFFFRGLLFGALRHRLSSWGTILATAAMFSIFHVIVGNIFAPERFLPSAFLGVVLGWVRWKTDSVLPTMVLHSAHNGILLSTTYSKDWLLGRGIGLEEQAHLPPAWLAVAAVASAAAATLIQLASTRPQR
jgi:ABC-2 type transport system permease protein/sodium transport system permease protein